MLHRFRRRTPGERPGAAGAGPPAPADTLDWFETDSAGAVLRQASFATDLDPPARAREHGPRQAGTHGAATVAASRAELTALCEDFGPLGVRLYRAVYGVPLVSTAQVTTVGPVGNRQPASAEVPVTAEEFERAWSIARRDRHFAPCDRGPLPDGARLTGTVVAAPWGIGVTGLFVELPLPVPGFVDMGHLGAAENWPAIGTAAEFEVLAVRFDAERRARPQVRLRPTGGRGSGRG
ncbi:hypothetical protein [Streptomyces triticagri]|nr:hypothetical protein [Streptomyces triticagri]